MSAITATSKLAGLGRVLKGAAKFKPSAQGWLGVSGQAIRNEPLLAGGLATGAAVGLGSVAGEGLASLGSGLSGGGLDAEIKRLMEARTDDVVPLGIRLQRLQQLMVENSTRLAQRFPHRYNEMLAGRRLPQGAVVIGGNPRSDIIEDIAYAMATGAYSDPEGMAQLGLTSNMSRSVGPRGVSERVTFSKSPPRQESDPFADLLGPTE